MSDSPIKTASWFAPLADDHIRVGISRGTPRRFEYRRLYDIEILGVLDAARVRDDLIRLADGRIPVLRCFERPGPGQWCHRAIAAQWLAQALGLQVPEVGFETARNRPSAPARSTRPAGLNFLCHRNSQHEPRPDPHRDRQTARGPARCPRSGRRRSACART